jgi:hypothetical protein
LVLPDYLSDIAKEMRARSHSIRRDFASHRLSAGENREDLVSAFLKDHIAARFGVSSGMVISHNGLFSNQADLIITDALNNSALYAGSSNELWTAESVYALVEVKTTLNLTELRDSINKGRRFKTLPRNFNDAGNDQRISDSLFVIWAFDGPSAETIKVNLLSELSSVPRAEQPDLIVVPDKFVVRGGSYLELSEFGQPGSPFRQQLSLTIGPALDAMIKMSARVQVYDMGENALLAWYVWFDSWLRQAGSRLTTLSSYLPVDRIYGRLV